MKCINDDFEESVLVSFICFFRSKKNMLTSNQMKYDYENHSLRICRRRKQTNNHNFITIRKILIISMSLMNKHYPTCSTKQSILFNISKTAKIKQSMFFFVIRFPKRFHCQQNSFIKKNAWNLKLNVLRKLTSLETENKY